MEQKALKVIKQMEKLRGGYWNVPYTTGEFLNRLIRLAGFRRVLEIGTSNGYSGIFMADALGKNGGMFYTIESHEERYIEARKNFAEAGLADLTNQIKGHAPEILNDLEGLFDMVFIDATKMEYLSYYKAIMPKIAAGGLLIADNCITHEDSVKNFLEYIEKDPKVQSAVLPMDNGLMLCLKTGDCQLSAVSARNCACGHEYS
jgi:caffeoyl-CoA O-methyltransferase